MHRCVCILQVKMTISLTLSIILTILCYICPISFNISINTSWTEVIKNPNLSPIFYTSNINQHHMMKIVHHSVIVANKVKIESSKVDTSTVISAMKIKKNKIQKSERACEKFKTFFASKQRAYHLTGTENIPVNISLTSNNIKWKLPLTTYTVVGGDNSFVGEFPHVVAVGSIDVYGHFILYCSGTLIDRKWILTAAHCTQSSLGHLTAVRLGVTNLRVNNSNEETIGIIKIVRHPSYKSPEMYFDIALLELDRLINFTAFIRPACLSQDFNDLPDNAWVCGWGTTEFGGRRSDILQKAYLKVIDNIWCSSKINKSIAIPHGIVPSMICAGSPDDNWNKDTCQGDSGGPLQIPLPYHYLFSIIGITSFGISCAFNESPGVYTRIAYYIRWIEDVVWFETDDNVEF